MFFNLSRFTSAIVKDLLEFGKVILFKICTPWIWIQMELDSDLDSDPRYHVLVCGTETLPRGEWRRVRSSSARY